MSGAGDRAGHPADHRVVEAVVAELRRSPPATPDDPELAALVLAILLEDTLGLVLDDDEIDRLARDPESALAGLVGRAQERS